MAPFPYGLYLKWEVESVWTIKIPIALKSVGADADSVRMAVGMVNTHEDIGGFELVAFQLITPTGRDVEFAMKKLEGIAFRKAVVRTKVAEVGFTLPAWP